MSGRTLQDHTGDSCRIVRHDSRWSACPPCDVWIDTHSQDEAAALIRATPALLNEARGWIKDSFEGVTAHTLDSYGITALVARNYDGGCAEFVRNSAPLIPAPCPHHWVEDSAKHWTCSRCGGETHT